MAEYIEREFLYEQMNATGAELSLCDALDMIECFPSADVAPVVHGRWNVVEGKIENAICSNCVRHFQSYYEAYHYCPNCGAKMDGGDER